MTLSLVNVWCTVFFLSYFSSLVLSQTTTCTINNNICEIYCGPNSCDGYSLECMAGYPCVITCRGCQDANIYANNASSLNITCITESSACRDSVINCPSNGDCSLRCLDGNGNGDELFRCSSASLICGTGVCSVDCSGTAIGNCDSLAVDATLSSSYSCTDTNDEWCPFIQLLTSSPTIVKTPSLQPSILPSNNPTFNPSLIPSINNSSISETMIIVINVGCASICCLFLTIGILLCHRRRKRLNREGLSFASVAKREQKSLTSKKLNPEKELPVLAFNNIPSNSNYNSIVTKNESLFSISKKQTLTIIDFKVKKSDSFAPDLSCVVIVNDILMNDVLSSINTRGGNATNESSYESSSCLDLEDDELMQEQKPELYAGGNYDMKDNGDSDLVSKFKLMSLDAENDDDGDGSDDESQGMIEEDDENSDYKCVDQQFMYATIGADSDAIVLEKKIIDDNVVEYHEKENEAIDENVEEENELPLNISRMDSDYDVIEQMNVTIS